MAKRPPKDTNGAPATDTATTMPPKVVTLLVRMATARQSAKNRLGTLIGRRGDLDSQLNQLGAGHTNKHLEVRSDMVVTLRAIDWQRARIKTLGDKIDELLVDPTQDILPFSDDLPDLEQRDPDEASLFRTSDGGDHADPVGTQSEFGAGEDDEDESPAGIGDEPVGERQAAEGDSETANQQLRKLLPGMFEDRDGRQLPIGDLAALEECINRAVGAVWYMDIASDVDRPTVKVRKETGPSAPVVFVLTRVGDVPAPRMAGGSKPAAKKSSKKAASKKKTSRKSAAK